MRRVKVLYINPQYIMSLFATNIMGYEQIAKICLPEIEGEYHVENVWFEPTRQAFGFLIHSDSFDLVEEFKLPPSIETKTEICFIKTFKSRRELEDSINRKPML